MTTMYKQSMIRLLWIAFGINLFVFAFLTEEKSLRNFFFGLLIATMYSLVIGLSNGWSNDYLSKKYSWIDDTKTRTILGIIVAVVVNVIASYFCGFVSFVLIQKVATPEEFFSAKYGFVNWFTINISLLICAFFHAKGFMEEWKNSTRKEVVEQRLIANSANAQFQTLKNQLDPHFLFNSLNVLDALIEENPQQAQRFTNDMSKIYRYVLDQKDKDAVTVEEEIDFAKTYAQLLKTRFEESVDFQFDIPKEIQHLFVVPLSLQLILENAIKHNFATEKNPLKIRIYHDNQYLVIENNLQLRDIINNRDGIGLSNIVQRYAMQTKRNVYIEKSEETFKIKIPLLNQKPSIVMETKNNLTNEALAYDRAVKRVKEIKGFYGNLISYCLVIPFLIFVNLRTSPEYHWFWWPMLGWGIGVVSHGLQVFGIGKNWEERKIKEIMEKEKF